MKWLNLLSIHLYRQLQTKSVTAQNDALCMCTVYINTCIAELSNSMLFLSQGCLFACEIRRFCQLLRNGNVRSIEAFCCPPQSLVFETPEWVELRRLIDPASLLHKSFVESCEGQGVCGISKKQPSSGVMVVKDDTTLVKFCDSFRLVLALTHTLTHTLTHSLTHAVTYSLTHSLRSNANYSVFL